MAAGGCIRVSPLNPFDTGTNGQKLAPTGTIGTNCVDLLPSASAQLFSYLCSTNYQVGLLLHFGQGRVPASDLREPSQSTTGPSVNALCSLVPVRARFCQYRRCGSKKKKFLFLVDGEPLWLHEDRSVA